MNWEGIIVCISLFIGLCLLATDKVSTEVVFFSQLIFFWNLGFINSDEALDGFSNKGLISIGALYVIVHPLSSNVYLNNIFRYLLKGKNIRLSMIKVCSVIAILSAFLNNTPLVQLVTPIIRKYSRSNKFPISRFLMPISFSSIIGGTSTLIGTSTNIIILSLIPSDIHINFFDTAFISVPFFFCYLLYNYFFNHKLLPIRSGLYRKVKNNFFINIRPNYKYYSQIWYELLANQTCSISTKTINFSQIIDDIGIQKEDIIGFYDKELNSLQRNINIKNISENVYVCINTCPEQINSIIKSNKYEIADCNIEKFKNNSFYECVVGNIKNMNRQSYENKYNCKILSVRNSSNFQENLSPDTIKKGSTILILASSHFNSLWRGTNDYYMISQFNIEETNTRILPSILFLIMIIVTAVNLYPIEKSACTLVTIYIFLRIIDIKDALRVINYSLLLVIACSFGISHAMKNSGVNDSIASVISNISGNWWVIFIITQLFSQILTEIITNNAVAVIMTQIIIDICDANSFDPKPFIISLMLSCSCSFITPYGYATNLIIQGTGGYKFIDYFKYGIFVKFIGFFITFFVYFF